MGCFGSNDFSVQKHVSPLQGSSVQLGLPINKNRTRGDAVHSPKENNWISCRHVFFLLLFLNYYKQRTFSVEKHLNILKFELGRMIAQSPLDTKLSLCSNGFSSPVSFGKKH